MVLLHSTLGPQVSLAIWGAGVRVLSARAVWLCGQHVIQNIIAQVEEPTDRVSNVVVAQKENGDLRICIGPHALNKALEREIYQLPILDDILEGVCVSSPPSI